MILASLILACAGPAGDVESHTPLPTPRLLRRISLDLRGTLPDVADLDRVEADPTQLDALVTDYLGDPLLESRLVHLFHQSWHMRIDNFNTTRHGLGISTEDEIRFERSVGEEPLRLMARVVADDLPWTDVVTADWTMANAMLLDLYPLESVATDSGEDDEWQPARYTDGRPAAGVLSTNGLWWRYPTSQFNRNRGRAAALSRLLLCFDYLTLPVSFEGVSGLEDAAGIESAVRNDPACITCHASLDPVAATLFGFWWVESLHPDAVSYTHLTLPTICSV